MDFTIFDIEADDLLDKVTKIHCLCYRRYNNGILTTGSLTRYNDIVSFFNEHNILIGHNIVIYDIPVVEKILGIKVENRLIDTLGLSWILFPERDRHGLEDYGEEYGVPKPKVEDWKNLSIEEYVHRCTEDTKINDKVWNNRILPYLKMLYENSTDLDRFIKYVTFKLDCVREQHARGIRLDVDTCKANLSRLEEEMELKAKTLIEVMPKKIIYKVISRPKTVYKKDGSISEHGKRWFENLQKAGLPEHHLGAFKLPVGEENGNPNSPDQLKNWLFSFGWKPNVFKYVKDKDTKKVRAVPQITEDKELTQSVKDLISQIPELTHFEGYAIIKHRVGLLKGFLECVNDQGYLISDISGFTNTMRMKHRKPIANLPKVSMPYGKDIRGVFVAPNKEEYLLCGSDMSSLEDSTKQHYMYFYDPNYVKEMRVPGFDPHLDVAKLAGYITDDEEKFYKWFNNQK